MEEQQKKSSDEQVAFEKARYEYCFKLYEKEVERSEALEKRAQFYFSFITLILGAIFLNIEFFEKVKAIAAQSKVPMLATYVFYISTIVLGLSLIASLMSLLEFIRLRAYVPKYPENFVSSLFAPDSKYLPDKTEKGLLRETALSCALALEFNIRITNKRTKWIQVSFTCIVFAVLSLFIILATVAYLLTLP